MTRSLANPAACRMIPNAMTVRAAASILREGRDCQSRRPTGCGSCVTRDLNPGAASFVSVLQERAMSVRREVLVRRFAGPSPVTVVINHDDSAEAQARI